MNTRPDGELLREYVETQSEAAFREIVERYSNLVYSSALRQLGSPDLARDISQRVFTELAGKARSLAPRLNAQASVVGWLYCATRYAVLAHMRDERRRRARERQAMESFNSVSETSTEWERIGPMLDDAMASLSAADREALLLRFFKNLDFRSVGAALGVSDDTAQKRVARSLDKLRAYLSRRGVATSVATLATLISTNAIQAGPVGLVTALTSASISTVSAEGTASLTILELIAPAKIKAAIIGGIVVASAAATLVVHHRINGRIERADAALRLQASQLARAQSENQQLANLARLQPNNREALTKLRAEVAALRSETARLSALQDQRREAVAKLADARLRPDPNIWQPAGLLEEAHDRVSYAKEVGLAIFGYASDHQGQMPSNSEQIASLLKDGTRSATNFTTDQFELVYRGTRSALTNYAQPGAILLLREKRAWKTASGQWAKVYVHCNGSGTALVARDGNFDDWEKRRIAPALVKQ